MKPFSIRFTKEAAKDVTKLSPHLRRKLREILLANVATDPFSGKKLVGDLQGFYSIASGGRFIAFAFENCRYDLSNRRAIIDDQYPRRH